GRGADAMGFAMLVGLTQMHPLVVLFPGTVPLDLVHARPLWCGAANHQRNSNILPGAGAHTAAYGFIWRHAHGGDGGIALPEGQMLSTEAHRYQPDQVGITEAFIDGKARKALQGLLTDQGMNGSIQGYIRVARPSNFVAIGVAIGWH